MTRYIFSRLLIAAVQVFLVATLVFTFLHLLPGDPVLVILGPERNPSPEVITAVRSELGLDKPLHIQYINWLGKLVRLDFGNSLANKKSVWTEVSDRIPRTMELVAFAMIIATFVWHPTWYHFSSLQRKSH